MQPNAPNVLRHTQNTVPVLRYRIISVHPLLQSSEPSRCPSEPCVHRKACCRFFLCVVNMHTQRERHQGIALEYYHYADDSKARAEDLKLREYVRAACAFSPEIFERLRCIGYRESSPSPSSCDRHREQKAMIRVVSSADGLKFGTCDAR